MSDPNLVVNCSKDMVNIVNNKMDVQETKKYSIWQVEHMDPFPRIPNARNPEIKIPGIRKLHSLDFTNGNFHRFEFYFLE